MCVCVCVGGCDDDDDDDDPMRFKLFFFRVSIDGSGDCVGLTRDWCCWLMVGERAGLTGGVESEKESVESRHNRNRKQRL